MSRTLAIARREFLSYFNGPTAYIVMILFLIPLGFFFWESFFLVNRASVRNMFDIVQVLLLLVAPALSMGLLSEEKRNGTIELLLTMPVRDTEVVLGKYLGALGVYVILLVLTLSYPICVSALGPLDWGPVWSGYLGLVFLGAAMLAIGLMASSWTENQLIALVTAAALCFAFWIVGRFLPFMPTWLVSVAEWLSFTYHFEGMLRGVIDSRNIVYFLSIIGLSLALAFRSLESRRWS